MSDLTEITEWSNPHYGETGYDKNCQRCVVAFEANMRGYAVEALPSIGTDDYPHDANWTKFFGKDKSSLISIGGNSVKAQKDKLLDQMGKWGDNSRAVLKVSWTGKTFGHVVNVVNSKSGVSAWDAQTGKRVSLDGILSRVTLKQTKLLRTDDANLDNTHVHKAIRVVED